MRPTIRSAHLNLGDSYRLLGRTADAKHEIETALQLDSTLAVAHYDLGLLYLFSPSVPGFQPLDQVAQAIKELETYKTMRGAKQASGDDSDELLSRAKAKQAELKLPAAAPAPAPPPKSATSGGGVDAGSSGSAAASAGDAGKTATARADGGK